MSSPASKQMPSTSKASKVSASAKSKTKTAAAAGRGGQQTPEMSPVGKGPPQNKPTTSTPSAPPPPADDESDSEDSEWEESFVYFELSDISSVEQFFQVNGPFDDPSIASGPSLTKPKKSAAAAEKKKKRTRGLTPRTCHGRPVLSTPQPPPPKPKEKKGTTTATVEGPPGQQAMVKKELTFHNLLTDDPILEFNGRYYTGKYQETLGTGLVFREKPESGEGGEGADPLQDEDSTAAAGVAPTSKVRGTGAGLQKLTKLDELNPPPDPVFGLHYLPDDPDDDDEVEYELVGAFTKIVKAERTYPAAVPPPPPGPAPVTPRRGDGETTSVGVQGAGSK